MRSLGSRCTGKEEEIFQAKRFTDQGRRDREGNKRKEGFISQISATANRRCKGTYRSKRNFSKTIIRHPHVRSWDRFIAAIENYVHGYQMTMAYKLLRRLNSVERDRAYLNTITESQRIVHYSNLWFDPTEKEFIVNKVGTPPEVDPIIIYEIKT